MTLGSNIQKIRKEASLSQEAFAEMFQVSRQTISNWENSKSYPDLETIIKISDSFHISLDVLLKEDLIMVKTFDHEVKSTRKYARVLVAIAIVFALLIGSFGIYSGVYFTTKNKLEKNFEKQLKENDFYKNESGYYSMDYGDGIVYSVPNQSMPGLLDFTLHFHMSNLYCNVDLEDTYVTIIWQDENDFFASATSKKDEKVVGSTSAFKENDFEDRKKLGDELGLTEAEMSQIIDKGNALYQDFYVGK